MRRTIGRVRTLRAAPFWQGVLPLSHLLSPQLRAYGRGQSAKGSSHRLSFEESAARRAGKSREDKLESLSVRENAVEYVAEDFPRHIDEKLSGIRAKLQNLCDSLKNVDRVLERLEVSVQGRALPIAQVGTISRQSGTVYLITPLKSAYFAPLQFALSKVDGVSTSREGSIQLKVEALPMTKERRLKVVNEIAMERGNLHGMLTLLRTEALDYLKELSLPDDLMKDLTTEVGNVVADKEQTFLAELELMADEVQQTSLDVE